MNADTSPFRMIRLECPVCTTINDFEQIRPGAFTEGDRDTDFCPRNHQWTNPKYQAIHPLLYFTATCSSCHYTRELNRTFPGWKNDAEFCAVRQPRLRQQHLQALADPDGLLRRLGGNLWPQQYPMATAINKLLIAIFDELLSDRPSATDLGRWFLRVAWLFREGYPASEGSATPRTQLRRRLFASLDRLKSSLQQVTAQLAEVIDFAQSHPESLASDQHDLRTPAQCRGEFARWMEVQSSLGADINGIITILTDEGRMLFGAGGDRSAPAERYGDYPSYGAFLNSLQQIVAWAPASEPDALAQAYDYHCRALETASVSDTDTSRLQLIYMAGEIARRLGRTPEAERHLTQATLIGRACVENGGDDRCQTALARHIVGLATQQLTRLEEFTLSNFKV